MFAKHLPPSAHQPRVLALDAASAADLPPETEIAFGDLSAVAPGTFDAIVGRLAPEALPQALAALRPGGRGIFAHASAPEALLAALAEAGFIHCLVEPHAEMVLYRGERPPAGSSTERVNALAHMPVAPSASAPFVFLLVQQTPNKPAWKLTPQDDLRWNAATVIDPNTHQPTLVAFTSLVKAVAFMQTAILAGWIKDVNKVGKYRAEAATAWAHPLRLNPEFETARTWALGPAYAVDPQIAITGEE